jgi:aerobic-type carbon monoxide dehydrogenase small subunit (CoxS/CutS family)
MTMTAEAFRQISFSINGRHVTRSVDVRSSLSDMLRDNLGLTSVKKGCEVGECGACSVLVDGVAIDSCIYLAIWVDGKQLRTTEGLADADGNLSVVQQAFVDATAIQCGFCTPGLVLTATELLESGHTYSRDELRTELAGHLCRCTGYQNILNAVELAQERHQASEQIGSSEFWDTVTR